MPNTQIPNTGSLEQVLRLLQLLALSSAYSVELTAAVNNMAIGPTLANLVDRNATTYGFNLSDAEFGGPTSWVGQEAGVLTVPGFAKCQITDQLRILDPFPILELVGRPGRPVQAIGGTFEERGFRGWWYGIDAIVITRGDSPQSVQREAMVMADAFEQLVERNESLGGLVHLISATGPIAPGGAREVLGAGLLAAAMVRFAVMVKRVSGLA